MEAGRRSARAQLKDSLVWAGRLFFMLGGLLILYGCVLRQGMLGQFCFFMFTCLTISNGRAALQLARAQDASTTACFVLQVASCTLFAVGYVLQLLVELIARQSWAEAAWCTKLSLLVLFVGEVGLCVRTVAAALRHVQYLRDYSAGMQPLLSANFAV